MSDDYREAPAYKSGEIRSYLSEPGRSYADGLKTITTAKELRNFLAKWPFMAADAIKAARKMKDSDVQFMQKNRMSNDPAVIDKMQKLGLLDVLMPFRLMTLSSIAQYFQAPEGAVYFRLWETGQHDEEMRVRRG